MSGPWMTELAELEDVATEAAFQAAQMEDHAPPLSKAAPQQPTVAPSSIDDTPMEPATSPRNVDTQMREWPVELQLPTREIGPRPQPEVYPTRLIVNDGQWTPEEHVEELRKAAQAGNYYAWIEKLEKKLKGRIESVFAA